MCKEYPSFILSIVFLLLLVIVILFRILIKRSESFQNWIIHFTLLRKVLYILFPVILTIILTFLFNLFLFHLDTKLNGFISEEADLWFVIFCNLFFALILFQIILNIQNQLIRIIFNNNLLSFVSIIEKSHFVTKRFASEIMSFFLRSPSFFTEISKIRFNPVQNLKELVLSLETNHGVELTLSLYATLLDQSLKKTPTKMLSTWDTKLVDLKTDDDYYNYIEELGKVYHKINEKKRIFLYHNDKDEFKRELNSSNILTRHTNWSFEEVYIIHYDKFKEIRDNHPMAERNVDDFVLYNIKNKEKWVIGKNSFTKKVYLNADKLIVTATEKFFNDVVSKSEKIGLTK